MVGLLAPSLRLLSCCGGFVSGLPTAVFGCRFCCCCAFSVRCAEAWNSVSWLGQGKQDTRDQGYCARVMCLALCALVPRQTKVRGKASIMHAFTEMRMCLCVRPINICTDKGAACGWLLSSLFSFFFCSKHPKGQTKAVKHADTTPSRLSAQTYLSTASGSRTIRSVTCRGLSWFPLNAASSHGVVVSMRAIACCKHRISMVRSLGTVGLRFNTSRSRE